MSRRGVVLYLVLTVLAIIGSILALLHSSFTAWNQRMRTDSDEVVAAHAARGALEALLYGVERAVEEAPPLLAPDVRTGRLAEVLLGDGNTLPRAVAGADGKTVLTRLLGTLPFEAIDELARSHPGAAFAYTVGARGVKPASDGVVDPILKTAELELEVTCTLRHARRSVREVVTIEVGSRLPGVLGHLTFAWIDVPAGEANRLITDQKGRPADDQQPLILYHDPGDYHPADPIWTPPSELKKPSTEGQLKVPRFAKVADLERPLARRGAVYLGAGNGPAITLRLAAGGPPLGQGFQLYPSADGKGFAPQRERLVDQPQQMRSMRATQAGTSAVQSAWVEGVAVGFYEGLENRPVLGTDAVAGSRPDGSSFLRAVGTAARPSLGLVYGRVRAGWSAVSNLAVDRDATGTDERAQEKTAGLRLPERESAEPMFANVTAAAYALDLERERTRKPLLSLFPFATPEIGLGRVVNFNHLVQTDDGRLVQVPSEQPWPTLELDEKFYQYAKLFRQYSEYSSFMSRRMEAPYNALLRHPGQDPSSIARNLLKQAFQARQPPNDEDLLTVAKWEHSDPLHVSLAQGPPPLFVDAADESVLDRTVRAAFGRTRFTDFTVPCWGEGLFRSSFFAGTNLDLGGWHVVLRGTRNGEPPPKLALGDVTVQPGGGGMLQVDELTLTSVRNAGTGASFDPLVVRANTLRLKGLGPFEGCFVVTGRLIVEVAEKSRHALVRGALALGPGTQVELQMPLAVVHDPALDPTGSTAPQFYRGAMRTAWAGRRSAGDDAIGRNPLRRSAGGAP